MTLLRIYCGRGFDPRHLHHHIMFNWLKKITKKQPVVINIAPETQDEIEEGATGSIQWTYTSGSANGANGWIKADPTSFKNIHSFSG